MIIQKNTLIKGAATLPIGIDVYHKPTTKPLAAVILAHGFKGFKDWGAWDCMARLFAEAGFLFVKFNFSHNGTSPDKPDEFGNLASFGLNNYSLEMDDLGLVIDWLYETYAPKAALTIKQLNLIGHSRGGGIAIAKTYEDARIDRLCTWAAINNFDRGWHEQLLKDWKKQGVYYVLNGRTKQQMPLNYQLVENYYAHRNRLDLGVIVPKIQQPWLIIHGSTDPAVSVSNATDLHQWNPNSQLLIIEGANHVFGTKHPWNNTDLTTAPHAQQLINETINFFTTPTNKTS